MSRKLLGIASAALVAGATLVAGPSAQAQDDPQIPILLGDLDLSTYVTVGTPVGSADDRYVRMLPLQSVADQTWEFRDSSGGGTAVVNTDTGGCLQTDPTGAEEYVTVGGCLRAPSESWEVVFGETGLTFVHQETKECLTRPDGTSADPRLTVAPCDGGENQTFSIVW
ncbi:RICIN domain-containing protein [Streptomyces sp. B6B3]|uniref:RICIN domain-containing protein n=1 Tax=Streptomyces sp. B6B3 TaxID=3153570 RepID=UPI00325EDD16